MRTKKRNLALATAAATAALLLAAPATAFAAPFTPDGSAPYGPNTICTAEIVNPEFPDPYTDSTCQPIPTFSWGTESIPAPTTDFLTNAQVSQWDWIGFVANEGSSSTGGAGTNGANFYVAPQNPAALPLIGSATLSVFGHNTEVTEVTGVSAYFVADSSIVASSDAYAGASGARSTNVPDGTATPIALTANADGTYDANLNIPSATWTYSTDGVLNGYGWSGRIVIVVEGIANGEPQTQIVQTGLNFYSQYLYDITNFYIEPPLNSGEIGVAGNGYAITGETTVLGPPTVEPPVVEPPVVEPPVVEPPVVEPPVVTPDPEPTPDGPVVQAGGDRYNPAAFLPAALLAGGVLGLTPLFFLLRRRERAEKYDACECDVVVQCCRGGGDRRPACPTPGNACCPARRSSLPHHRAPRS